MADEVESGEGLKGADGVDGAEDGDDAREPDVAGKRGGGEDDGGGAVQKVFAVVFADTKGVEADLIGELDAAEELAHFL